MIQYCPDYWSVTFAFSLRGSVLPKASVWALSCSLIAAAGHLTLNYFDLTQDLEVDDKAIFVFKGFNFILGFLVVFRSQQAFARWWEGGTLLQQIRGEWFNAFSSLLAFSNNSETKRREVQQFQQKLVRLMSLLYAAALQQASTVNHPQFEVIDLTGFDKESLAYLDDAHDRCEVVLQWIQRSIVEANSAETIVVAPPILSRVYNQLGNGIVNLNNARKISDFPIPFPLAQTLTFMLMINWLAIAILCSVGIRKFYWAAIISFVAEIAYWTVNYIAIELEMPFGDDPNDLPLQEMQKDLNYSLHSLMSPLAQNPPSYKPPDFATAEKMLTRDLDFDRFEEESQAPAQIKRPSGGPASILQTDKWRTKPRGRRLDGTGASESKARCTRTISNCMERPSVPLQENQAALPPLLEQPNVNSLNTGPVAVPFGRLGESATDGPKLGEETSSTIHMPTQHYRGSFQSDNAPTKPNNASIFAVNHGREDFNSPLEISGRNSQDDHDFRDL